jgi:hypothetical protein
MPTPPEIVESLRGNPDPDAKVLFHLAQNGSDLTKVHEPDFAFYFGSETAAKAAESKLGERDFDVTVEPPCTDHDEYLVVGVKKMVPELDALNHLSDEFEELAAELGGRYDGWGAETVD